ncbi:MAG TPA: hypothetical protein VK933_12375, partial [Longimicrobiales bacterium]|nr:hypothetical protein [Longimicrobiales bacterium]
MSENGFQSVGLGWLEGNGAHSDIVLSTRVRLARNLQGHAFAARIRDGEREEILEQVRSAVQRTALAGGAGYELSATPTLGRRILHERHLVSRELAGLSGDSPARGSGLFMGPHDAVGVMVNEEDHLRMQAILSGLRLQEAFHRVDELDEELGVQLPFAYHQEY